MNCTKMTHSNIAWDIIELYFKNNHLEQLIKHQIESYDKFIEYELLKTIEMFNPIIIKPDSYFNNDINVYGLEIEIRFENLNINRPQIHENNGAIKYMYPKEARSRNFTYSSVMTINLNIKYTIRTGDNLENIEIINKVLNNIHIGKIPIMLKSSLCILKHNPLNNYNEECKYDPGGYFIINGSEKTVLTQERVAENQIYVFNQKKTSKWSHIAEIKSVPDYKQISPKQINVMLSNKNNIVNGIYIQIPRLKNPIPIFIIFRALNVISDKDICKYILLNLTGEKEKKMLYALKTSITDANEYLTKESAIAYIQTQVSYIPLNMTAEEGKKKKEEFTNDVLMNDLFPHCRTIKQKIYLMGYMTNKLLQIYFGWINCDDRDSYINKRLDTCGVLLNNLFRNYFNKLVKDMIKYINKEIIHGSWKSKQEYINIINLTNIYKIIKSTTIENGLKRALATGDFGIKNQNTNKVGVAQVLNRLTYIASLSHLRRINTPIDKSGKLIPPRKLHSTSWGYLCPAETPEGQPVGVVKNLSYMAHITISSNSTGIYNFLENTISIIDNLEPSECHNKVKVFINGTWIGITDDPINLYNELKIKKYKGNINIYTSIVFDYQRLEIRICNDSGRLTRPVFKVTDGKLLITNDIIKKIKTQKLQWYDLISCINLENSIVEYIDPQEQNMSLIAMKPQLLNNYNPYTHCEIHPSTIFGILASCIPFPEHNQSPRNTYQCAMGKQAMGIYVTNYHTRMDKTSLVLTYPGRPLVDTRIMNLIQLHNIPSGIPVIVAIATHTGYNQEDSILINQGAVDRGLLQATIYHTEKDEDKKYQGDIEIRGKPDVTKTKGTKFGNYNKLNNLGVIPENTLVENRDIIMGKVLPIKEAKNDHTKVIKYTDQSKTYKTNEDTYIDKNYLQRNGDGYNFCKVKLRTLRQPKIGDKFSSRHGQKGTIGNIIPECDMPFTKDGLKPDIIINPHAIPSRMTIAQLKETILGKLLLELGLFGDGTSFTELTMETIKNNLLKNNFHSEGNEILYDGLSGQQIETSIFMGPCFYQRLKHMVVDKAHSRSIGPMVNMTRQPAEGRSRDGGLRFGEMERDCMVSHGAATFTKTRLYDSSDKYEVPICNNCGLIAIYNDKQHIHLCKNCENRTSFSRVKIPYSAKLLFQELISMNVAPRIITEQN